MWFSQLIRGDRLPRSYQWACGRVGSILAGGILFLLFAELSHAASPGGDVAACRRPWQEGRIILLVHGLTTDVNRKSEAFGKFEKDGWTGMIGYLSDRGFAFGGMIDRDYDPVDRINKLGVKTASAKADFFALQFSVASKEKDWLKRQAAELAETTQFLCALTGKSRVTVVAHSAGGVVARTYLQNASNVPYRQDIDRLITIATPHLGCSARTLFLQTFGGSQAEALKVDSSDMQLLNGIPTVQNKHALPRDVDYASIVICDANSVLSDVAGDPLDVYLNILPKNDPHPAQVRAWFDQLPPDYREGGDGILSVRTQNLRVSKCAADFEAQSGRAVQYIAAPVLAYDKKDGAHSLGLHDRGVQDLVYAFITDDGNCWKPRSQQRGAWVDRAAACCAARFVRVFDAGTYSDVHARVDFQECIESIAADGSRHSIWSYTFFVEFKHAARLAIRPWTYNVWGTMYLDCDEFARVKTCRPQGSIMPWWPPLGMKAAPGIQLGSIKWRLGRKEYTLAIEEASQLLQQKNAAPTQASAHQLRGEAWLAKAENYAKRGHWAKSEGYDPRGDRQLGQEFRTSAIADFTAAIQAVPPPTVAEITTIYNNLAWLLATHPDATHRNGNQAVRYALVACNATKWQDWKYLDTLAAANAEQANFQEAIKWQKKVLEMLARGPVEPLEDARKRLTLYEQGQSFHEE